MPIVNSTQDWSIGEFVDVASMPGCLVVQRTYHANSKVSEQEVYIIFYARTEKFYAFTPHGGLQNVIACSDGHWRTPDDTDVFERSFGNRRNGVDRLHPKHVMHEGRYAYWRGPRIDKKDKFHECLIDMAKDRARYQTIEQKEVEQRHQEWLKTEEGKNWTSLRKQLFEP